jgi:molybdopterin molybdotransferase
MLQSAPMLSVAEAQSLVLDQVPSTAGVRAPLEVCLGLVLAEDIAGDIDMPPFDKALMDGYAVRAADLDHGKANLKVVGEVTAGNVSATPVRSGEAVRIMTGAPIPDGADSVVMIERTQSSESGLVAVDDLAFRRGQNILSKGLEMKRGETILGSGMTLRPQEIGVLAAAGRTKVAVFPRPRGAIISTGDELVDVALVPGPGQIRNTNGPMLAAQVSRAGASAKILGIARDQMESLRPLISAGLEFDMLILSGGVSAGKLDLVPAALQELGVGMQFHKVAMKPGKPAFFGTRGRTLVFGLPGNPVSALVCFELFVRPAIRRLLGHAQPLPDTIQAVLETDFSYKTDRPTYYPAQVQQSAGKYVVRPVAWLGSADLRGLCAANAFIVVPAGDQEYCARQDVTAMLMD